MLRTLMFICAWTITFIDTARILAIFPTPSISHQVVFRVLTLELAKRGHEIVVITTDPVFPKGEAPANFTEIDIHDISYDFLHSQITDISNLHGMGKDHVWISIQRELINFYNIIEVQMQYEPVKKLINEKREFDLLLVEAFITPAIGYSHIFKAPVIQVSSFGVTLDNLETIGASTHPILYPNMFRTRLHNLTLWDKIREFYMHVQLMIIQKQSIRSYDDMLQRVLGPNTPSVTKLLQNVDMMFLNVHPIWMNNQPMPPSVIFMGGLHQKPKNALPEQLQHYLDASENGVIYVSFGTNVKPMMFPPEILKIITESLSELPYDVLMKWDDEEIPWKTKNMKISKWLPQSDLLRHPNVKAFLMQGGLQSTDEAISAGVPLICIPMLGDQWFNAEKYVHLNIGFKLDLWQLTKTQLKNAIESTIRDQSYRENIVKLREQMYDQPQSPLERAIWWTEHVIRHGGARHLRSPAANMSWAEYYELEIVLLALASLFISVIVVVLFVVLTIRRCGSLFIGSNVKVKKS